MINEIERKSIQDQKIRELMEYHDETLSENDRTRLNIYEKDRTPG